MKLLLALLALIAAAPLHSKSETSSARKGLASWATCLLKAQGYKLRAVLDLPVGSRSTRARWVAIAQTSCTTGDVEAPDVLAFQPSLMRAAVYEALYRKDFGVDPAGVSVAAASPITYPFSTIDQFGEAAEYRLAMTIGDCMTRLAPADVRRLVLTAVASVEEAKAVDVLIPVAGKCMDAGHTLTISKSILRGLAAEPLYRHSVAERNATHA